VTAGAAAAEEALGVVRALSRRLVTGGAVGRGLVVLEVAARAIGRSPGLEVRARVARRAGGRRVPVKLEAERPPRPVE
jgi:hypothetical protein